MIGDWSAMVLHVLKYFNDLDKKHYVSRIRLTIGRHGFRAMPGVSEEDRSIIFIKSYMNVKFCFAPDESLCNNVSA